MIDCYYYNYYTITKYIKKIVRINKYICMYICIYIQFFFVFWQNLQNFQLFFCFIFSFMNFNLHSRKFIKVFLILNQIICLN